MWLFRLIKLAAYMTYPAHEEQWQSNSAPNEMNCTKANPSQFSLLMLTSVPHNFLQIQSYQIKMKTLRL